MAGKRRKVGDAFGTALRAARAQRGWTQEELGAAASYSTVTVSFLENGRRQPTLSAILALEEALGLPAGELVRRTRERLPGLKRAR